MNLKFAPRGVLQIDDVQIRFPNFEGRPDKFTRAGDRSFHIVIDGGTVTYLNGQTETVDAATMADILAKDENRDGAGWNVKIKPPRNEDEDYFITMKVKVKFGGYGPDVYLTSGNAVNLLNEQTVGILDKIAIANIDLDIRPYDTEVNGKPVRSAYLNGADVTQSVDRFAERHAARFGGEEIHAHMPCSLISARNAANLSVIIISYL